jgi:hypothetical protein
VQNFINFANPFMQVGEFFSRSGCRDARNESIAATKNVAHLRF